LRYNVPYFVTKGFYVIIDRSIVTNGLRASCNIWQHVKTIPIIRFGVKVWHLACGMTKFADKKIGSFHKES
jgi:hypothetical protein